ncbi:MAG: exonuclease subunit SbcD [Synechococcales bacterium]|nr:exonuclease subunit SbcD [Synechococcales bacterium]
MVKVFHLSDIHLGSGFSHGRINPETGLNTRFEDFVRTLSYCIDRALAESVDLVLFGGDAFPDATPVPYIQQAFAQQFQRLVAAGIPTVLLVGNHDQHSQGAGGASLCIYRTLGVPGVIVGDTLATHRMQTQQGSVQVITLPWLNRSTLMTKAETEGMSMAAVGEVLLDRLKLALEGEIRQLDPTLPTILLAHVMTDNARFGAEQFLAVGKGFTVPLSLLIRDCFDYVALGHVHKHQILHDCPPIVYPGSIERVDFSEELEEKGFVLANVTRRSAIVEFCPVPARPFRTIAVDLCDSPDPAADLLQAIADCEIQDAVVRVLYRLYPEQTDAIVDRELHAALVSSHSYTLQAEIHQPVVRSRLPELGVGNSLGPLDALQAYLNNREDLQDLRPHLLEAAERLLDGEPSPLPLSPSSSTILPQSNSTSEDNIQLRLL